MKMRSMEDLFVDELRDLYDAENQLVKALPKVAKKASSPQLQTVIKDHLEQTKGHVDRLKQVFEQLGVKARGKKCEAMQGILDEGEELLGEDCEPAVKDAGIIAAAQKVEHYEIASYGCVHEWAQQLGHGEVATFLRQTLMEEKEADEKLNQLAKREVNKEAVHEPGMHASTMP